MSILSVQNLVKSFSFPVKKPGQSFWRNLLRPEQKTIVAVDNISFSVEPGERVAFIGPNGAGKSTTIKMLAGILHPTAGTIDVLGYHPTRDRRQLAYQIGTVFGQRSQLFPNLPLTDSFEFFGVMYDFTSADIKARTAELIKLFELEEFARQPVRKLSLGQRMRAEIATSLFHRPALIFLDEPTIGLDVVAKKNLRDLLISINTQEATTLFLTSHDVGDIESLCSRTIVINYGKIIRDLPTVELAKDFSSEKYIELILGTAIDHCPMLPAGLTYVNQEAEVVTIAVDTTRFTISDALQKILPHFNVRDVNVYNTDLETVIRYMYEHA